MNPISLVPQSGSNFKLYYLVPVSFVYLFAQFGNQFYLLFSLVALIGAIGRHAQGEALFGPEEHEKAELSKEDQIRRSGTLLYRDKVPSGYSATTWTELYEEGEFRSNIWAGIMIVLTLFQGSLSVLYLFAVHDLYIHRFEIDFVGALLLFSLAALVINGAVRTILPNVSQMEQGIQDIDSELKENLQGFMFTLYADGISTAEMEYEPADGGIVGFECEVDYDFDDTVREDVNRVAITFCSVVDRSSYPIKRADVTLKTTDNVALDFQIDSEWCRQVLDGQLSSDHYLQRVYRTASIKSPDYATVEQIFKF